MAQKYKITLAKRDECNKYTIRLLRIQRSSDVQRNVKRDKKKKKKQNAIKSNQTEKTKI